MGVYMGVYSDYLNRKWDFQTLTAEPKVQLARISQFRNGRGVLVYAADFNKNGRDIRSTMIYLSVRTVGSKTICYQFDCK